MHDMGVTHRDLKCANILLNPSNGDDIQVKITDFGNAKGDVNTSTYGAQTTKLGTLYFKAPELYWFDNQLNVLTSRELQRAEARTLYTVIYLFL